jgi:hypothetical protein
LHLANGREHTLVPYLPAEGTDQLFARRLKLHECAYSYVEHITVVGAS